MTALPLVDSYLAELARHLPAPIREDVVGELRDDLTQQIEERAESNGREPAACDERAVLGALGHPLKVASQYGERRYLIGPELYPAYLQTLRSTVFVALVIVVLLKVVLGNGTDNVFSFDGLLGSLFEIALWVAGIVTVVFLVLESTGEKLSWYHDWTPDVLRPEVVPVANNEVATNFVSEIIFLLLWNSVVQFDWSLEPGLVASIAEPIVNTLWLPMNVLFGALVVVHGYVLLRGQWPRWASAVELALCIALLAAIGVLLRSQPLLVLPAGVEQGALAVVSIGNSVIAVALWVVAGLTIWDSVLAWGRIRR